MTKKSAFLFNTLFFLLLAVLVFEITRDSFRNGDFIGYLNAGNAVLNNQHIYADYLNTWPPFFSLFSVVLAWGDKVSHFLIRFVWLAGSFISMYFIIMLTAKMCFQKKIIFPFIQKAASGSISISNPVVMIPSLLIFRFLLDNFANLQINVYILLLSLLAVFHAPRKKILAGLFLALGISLKMYPVFFLLWFIYCGDFKTTVYTFLFLILINAIAIPVFGFASAVDYYIYWWRDIATASAITDHKNQSFFAFMHRLLSSDNSGNDVYANILNLSSSVIKNISYSIVFLFALYPAWLLRNIRNEKDKMILILASSIVFCSIPLLSPVAWKAFFIFLWMPYFISYLFLFRMKNELAKNKFRLLKTLFWCSALINIFSTQGIVGTFVSQTLESYSCITIGTTLLLILLQILYKNRKLFIVDSASVLS